MVYQPKLYEPPSDFNGNKKLVKHGIQTEDADYRAHVCYPGRMIYVFPTRPAVAIASKYPIKPASVPGSGITTATGRAVPISCIPEMQSIPIPPALAEKYLMYCDDSTTTKGNRSVQIFLAMLKAGKVALPMNGTEVISAAAQIAGSDVIALGNHKIQVKCDWPASRTGNVYLQFEECNPGRMH